MFRCWLLPSNNVNRSGKKLVVLNCYFTVGKCLSAVVCTLIILAYQTADSDVCLSIGQSAHARAGTKIVVIPNNSVTMVNIKNRNIYTSCIAIVSCVVSSTTTPSPTTPLGSLSTSKAQ